MKAEASFYDRLYSTDAEYGGGSYDIERLVTAPGFRRWIKRVGSAPFSYLEVACGKGQFILDLTTRLKSAAGMSVARIAAVDLIKPQGPILDRITPQPEFQQASVDGTRLSYDDASFDLVTCNHVLEHIFETEKFLRELRRVVRPTGLVVVSVPNVAAWMNRITFLFGGQPLSSEVGTERITYGYWPKSLQSRLTRYSPSGHIRDFTPRSLRELTAACGFRPVGWWAQNGGMFPTLNRNLGILLEAETNPV